MLTGVIKVNHKDHLKSQGLGQEVATDTLSIHNSQDLFLIMMNFARSRIMTLKLSYPKKLVHTMITLKILTLDKTAANLCMEANYKIFMGQRKKT